MPISHLRSSDPRAGERTWQLLAQVAGRAGRGEKPGGPRPNLCARPPLMQSLVRGDRDGFLAQEKRVAGSGRIAALWSACAVIVSGHDARETERFARARAARTAGQGHSRARTGTSAACSGARAYRWRFLVKAGRETNVQAFARLARGVKTTRIAQDQCRCRSLQLSVNAGSGIGFRLSRRYCPSSARWAPSPRMRGEGDTSLAPRQRGEGGRRPGEGL